MWRLWLILAMSVRLLEQRITNQLSINMGVCWIVCWRVDSWTIFYLDFSISQWLKAMTRKSWYVVDLTTFGVIVFICSTTTSFNAKPYKRQDDICHQYSLSDLKCIARSVEALKPLGEKLIKFWDLIGEYSFVFFQSDLTLTRLPESIAVEAFFAKNVRYLSLLIETCQVQFLSCLFCIPRNVWPPISIPASFQVALKCQS